MPRKREKTISRRLFDEAKEFFRSHYENRITERAFESNYRKYINYCRTIGLKTKDECGDIFHIQEYADYLEYQGYSASTIHTYLAPVAIYHEINLKEIDKPKRYCADYTKNRSNNGRTARNDNNLDSEEYRYTTDFASRVGIRRSEMARLTKEDIVIDESGYCCVRVKRGKGGKMQLQRLHPDDVDTIKRYFDEAEQGCRIFTKADMTNKLAYHALRAKRAQAMYCYYAERLQNEPDYREQLTGEIRARWMKYNINKKTGKPKSFPDSLYTGTYALRGRNKAHAEKYSFAIEYDRLALLAVSVFDLAHWRLPITMDYLLMV